jgi:hypothetical protein
MLGEKLGNGTGKVILRRVLAAGPGRDSNGKTRSAEPEPC